jgi:hypothetical protein
MIQKAKPITSNSQITDVVHFFSTITEKYEFLARDILQTINKITVYSPQQIFDECQKIGEQRNKLTIMDQQMLDIIELAGSEIAQTSMIHDYRVALARANMACSDLHQQLQALKTTMQEA